MLKFSGSSCVYQVQGKCLLLREEKGGHYSELGMA
jgi:hypothetical protein